MSCEVISDPISNWALINAGILKWQLSLLNFVLSVALLYCFNLMSNWEDIWWWLPNYKRATLYHALLYCLFYCKYARNLQNEHNALISEKWNYYWDNKLIRKVITEEQVHFFCAASLEKMATSIYYMDDMYSNHNPDFDIFCMKRKIRRGMWVSAGVHKENYVTCSNYPQTVMCIVKNEL